MQESKIPYDQSEKRTAHICLTLQEIGFIVNCQKEIKEKRRG